ncbi:hypothetical protein KZZ52_26985 [Dactylosporangium sp. AC04546]|uniref:hypothetical protein n=1 Tax=Dactylosporangium sp. AC04546 TaxID=2862460 RepID=UPI001EDE7349|nr:hypothetical protein [Dactylosporangium sp. AC04546]WVK88912.1 hypothetical protein KZZ52_26985 [Dactylosporangium sp. AC04546]
MNGSLLVICDWGCGITSLIDVRDPAGPMWAIDPNGPSNPSDALFQQDFTFTEWLGRWVEGALDQPAAEYTGQWGEAETADDDLWRDPWQVRF